MWEEGGVFYVTSVGRLELTDVSVISNSVDEKGGAIYNDGGKVIAGNNIKFDSNKALNSTGGAIFNSSGTITIGSGANFIGNTALKAGGAICVNEGTITIGNNARFDSNISQYSEGGAIHNYAGTITIGSGAVFTNNETTDEERKNAGAISNYKDMVIGSNALFKNNKATCDGGVLYNGSNGTFTIQDGARFVDNTAKENGGAIYNNGTLNLIANTKNVEFTGNKSFVGAEKESFNAIRGSGQVNMWASNNANIIFNDSISGSGVININKPVENYQENIGTGKVFLNADMSQYTGIVNFYGGTIELGKNGTLFGSNNDIKNIDVDNATIKMANGKVANAGFGINGSVNIRKELNLTVDADLENKAMDMALFITSNIGSGKVNVKEINIIKDSDKTTRVDFAPCVNNSNVITVNKARSVLYSYDAKLDYGKIEFDVNNGGHYSDVDGYYYTFTKKGFNPVTAAGAVSASVGGYATQSVVMGQAFASMDRQVAVKNQPTVAPKAATKQTTKPATKATNSKTTTNNTQNKKEDKKQAPKKDTKQQNKKTSYIQSSNLYVSAGDQVFAEPSKIERGAWLRPFILNETVKVGDTDVDNNLYGTLAGIDLPVKGDILASFYLGYAGSKQKVEEVKSNQTGYVLGATGMLIKEKWYLGATANMIFNKASVDNGDETNDIDMNMFGIAVKAGYNYVINEKWTLEPNATLMYGIVNCGEYETALTKVDSLSVNNILFEPQVKAKLQMKDGWQPYGLLGYAANLSSKPTIKTEAGDIDLDSIDGYVEFGAGVNKDFLNTAWSCYAQLSGRSGGRSGFAGNLGIKYKF
jgi:predicted outer membrane repeat protein